MKQWSLKSVYQSLNYEQVVQSDVHHNFSQWLKKEFKDKKLDIVDIGGGNGRVCLNIKNNIKTYTCLDLNPYCVEKGKKFFNDESIRFILCDIDNETWSERSDLIYIDSVLTMLENPFKIINDLMMTTDYIFINRVRFGTSTIKSTYQWSGMNKESVLYNFDLKTMQKFCDDAGYLLQIYDDISFIIKKQKNL